MSSDRDARMATGAASANTCADVLWLPIQWETPQFALHNSIIMPMLIPTTTAPSTRSYCFQYWMFSPWTTERNNARMTERPRARTGVHFIVVADAGSTLRPKPAYTSFPPSWTWT